MCLCFFIKYNKSGVRAPVLPDLLSLTWCCFIGQGDTILLPVYTNFICPLLHVIFCVVYWCKFKLYNSSTYKRTCVHERLIRTYCTIPCKGLRADIWFLPVCTKVPTTSSVKNKISFWISYLNVLQQKRSWHRCGI